MKKRLSTIFLATAILGGLGNNALARQASNQLLDETNLPNTQLATPAGSMPSSVAQGTEKAPVLASEAKPAPGAVLQPSELYYPESDDLKKIYEWLFSSGDLEQHLYVDEPSTAHLRKVYDFARESGRLDATGRRLKPVVPDSIAPFDASQALFPVVKSTVPEKCVKRATACGLEVGGVTLACLALIVPGAGWIAGGVCGSGLVGLWLSDGGNCEEINDPDFCPRVTYTEGMTTSAGAKGSTGSHWKKVTSTCSGVNRVQKVYSRRKTWADSIDLISDIKLVCTDGTELNFINNESGATASAGYDCRNGKMAQGIFGKSGSYIDGMGVTCDYVVESSDTTDFSAGYVGDETGGGDFSLKCPEHRYVVGLNVWRDRDYISVGKRFARGIEVLCR